MRIKMIWFSTVFLVSAIACYGQKNDCAKLRNGVFRAELNGNVDIIKRSGALQLEYFNGSKKPDHYAVKWLNDCTYTLTPDAAVLAENANLPKNVVFTVQIIKTSATSYTQTTTSNVGNFKATCEMVGVEPTMELYIK